MCFNNTKSCTLFIIIIYCSDMIFSTIVYLNNHNNFVQHAISVYFFKLMHLKKSMACVNIAQLQSFISSLEMFIVYLSNARFFLFIFAFAHHHVAHSFVLSIVLFYFVPHVLIFSNYQKGISQVSSVGYSKDFFVISHILLNMLEINVYSVINSKVFGLIVGVYLLLAIVKQKFNDYKHMVEVQRMQLGNKGGINANSGIGHANQQQRGKKMQFDYIINKNGPRCKRMRKCMKIKNNINWWFKQCKISSIISYCQFLMGTCLLVVNRQCLNWHIPLSGLIGLYATFHMV